MERNRPEFSIIVPTYGRPGQLALCLRALDRLRYSRERFEVLVIDDGSPAPPDAVVRRAGTLDVVLLTQRHAGAGAARNTGAARARGRFLAFTDDDCAPAPDWLDRLAARFVATPDRAIGGRTLNALPDNRYAVASQCLIDHLYAYFNADPDDARFLASNNFAVPADRFHTLGGFDVTFPGAAAEDREFCDRWRHRGYRLTYAPEAIVHHAHPLTGRSFCTQHFNYGRGAHRFHQTRARRGAGRVRLEPPQFYLDLLHPPRSQRRGRASLWLAALLGVSQGANAAGFAWELIRRRTAPFSRTGLAKTDQLEPER